MRIVLLHSVLSLFFFLFLASILSSTHPARADDNGVYIVYMGAATSTKSSQSAKLLNSLLRRKKDALVHTYKRGFAGFAARLSKEEAHSIARMPGVVSVFPDPMFKLHTTRSWDFLRYQTDLKTDSGPAASGSASQGSDTIIGILDTGIWPESASFSEKEMGPIPSRWKGTCMDAPDFNSSNCNKKLIGARYYKDSDDSKVKYLSARDTVGHGTHVSSTAAGAPVADASYYGLASGTAKGGAPGARIAMYAVCSLFGCRGSAILAAFDDAIADGVDILSLSLGAPSYFMPSLTDDPIAIGAFHAVEKGITVVCSAGNDGPSPATVVNSAPWILTVAASTIDRDFESDVVLGGKQVIKGEGINFANLQSTPNYPLIHAKSAKTSSASEAEARNCNPDSLDAEQIKGKIVLCENVDDSYSPREKKETVEGLGGIGLVVVNDQQRRVASSFGSFPITVISTKDADEIIAYVNSTKNPMATILPTKVVTDYKPAPSIAYFSSRGPSSLSKSILKPDIAAPGVNILAAWIANDTSDEGPAGKDPALFNVISGTSMACPHVSGIAATIKSQNPEWSPSAIRSAIMTTAIQVNNLKTPVTTDSDSPATPYDFGAGEVSTSAPLKPGLVYESTTLDYLNFLCYQGYNITSIKAISRTVPASFACPQNSSADAISNINYPSIAINKMSGEGKKVTRTVTNVGGDGDTVYTVTVEAPPELQVQVTPTKLQFTKNGQKLSYDVSFSATKSSLDKDVFGSITWANGDYKVRIPFAVSK